MKNSLSVPETQHVILRKAGQPDEAELREFIDYKTSMITDEDPLRGLLFY